MAQDIYGVEPGSTDYSHEIVLKSGGKSIGLHLLNDIQSLRPVPPPRQPPVTPVHQASWHTGRGVETWTPNQYGFYDSAQMWTTTPNKLHPQLLIRWATGIRDAEMNMPDQGKTHIWKSLYNDSGAGDYRYLDVAFSASATSNRRKCVMIIRRKVVSGVDNSSTLTLEWCPNSAGKPGAAAKTITKTYSNLPDVISYYVEFDPGSNWAVTSGTTYHLKIYGASTDTKNNCWEVLCSQTDSGFASSNGSSWASVAWSPYYRITDNEVNQRLFFFPFAGAWYCVSSRVDGGNSQLWIHGTRGRTTAATASSLTDSGAGQYGGTFPNMAGWKIRIIRGLGKGQIRTITSNTATVITPDENWDTTPDNTSQYVCYAPNATWKEITGHGLGWVSNKPAYSNQTVYFPQDDTTDIRIMRLDYSKANDHGFDVEDTNHNQAYFLANAYDATDGPQLWRANQVQTTAGSPKGQSISISRGLTAPAGTALTFGTDVTFNASILTGDNTFDITSLFAYKNNIYVAKEDTMYTVVNDKATEIKYGADASPSQFNGVAAVEGMDGLLYIAANHDVMFISGSTTYPTHLPDNLPSNRSGYVKDMVSRLGWLFAAVDAGRGSQTSSIMKYSFDTKTWSEQMRAPIAGKRMRSVAWLSLVESAPCLVAEYGGDIIYQQFPAYGVRPVQDSSCLYQHEGVLEMATVDLLNTNPKYFGSIEIVTKGLAATGNAAVYGREVGLEFQLDNNIGTSRWTHGGAFTLSPTDEIIIARGSQHKLRMRLRIDNDDPANPPVIENVTLSLFQRMKLTREWMMDIQLSMDEEGLTPSDLYDWLVKQTSTAEPVMVKSIVPQLHKRKMTLQVEPNMNFSDMDDEGWEGVANLLLTEVIE